MIFITCTHFCINENSYFTSFFLNCESPVCKNFQIPVLELSINNIEFVDNIWRSWRDSFPDLNIEFKDIEFYNNVIIVDWTGEGTQHGEFQNLEPTGKSVFYPGKTMWTFNNGMITNYMCQIDLMNIYKQLGYFLVQEEYPQQETIRKNKNILVGRLSSVRLYRKYYLTPREVEVLSLWLLGFQAKKNRSMFRHII